jgi:uncharacterized membrane protein
MPHLPLSLIVWIASLLVISGFALWRGGTVERIVGVANLLAYAATLLVEDRRELFDPQIGIMVVDLAFLALLTWLAATSGRNWLLFAAAFQLLAVVIHLAIMADPGVRSLAYFRGLIIWSYLILASMGIGAWLEWRARRAGPPQSP